MIKRHFNIIMAISVLAAACSGNPYKPSNKIYKRQVKELLKPLSELPVNPVYNGKVTDYQIGTVNFNLRKPNYVIIHHTAQKSVEQTLKTFTISRTQVSAHYLIAKDGKIYHLLNDYLRAWHAGVARWGSISDINSSSIGIELDNDGLSAFSEPQISALLALLKDLKVRYNIPTGNFIGHSDIAPRRKVDPSKFFPWERLAQQGYGYWPDAYVMPVSPGFRVLTALKGIGYDTRDSIGAMSAFRLHFMPNNSETVISDSTLAILNNVSEKYEK